MSVNLFDMFSDAVGGTLVEKASAMLGESSATTTSAVGAILPSLMGSMLKTGSSDEGAAGMLDFLKGGNFGDLLGNVGDLFGGGDKTSGLLASGSGILKYLVGDKLGSLVDLISGSTGMKVGSTNTMMKMVGPLLMGVVGKYVKGKALDALGLKNLLMGQKDELSKRMPSGLGDLLGLGGLMSMGKKATEALSGAAGAVGSTAAAATGAMAGATKSAATATADTAKAATGGIGKLLPYLGLALVALGILWWVTRGKGGDTLDNMKDKTAQTMKDAGKKATDGAKAVGGAVADGAKKAGNAVTDGAKAAADALRSIKLPGGKEIKAAAGSFAANLAGTIGNKNADLKKALTFDNINFASGSANIPAESEAQLQSLADILSAYGKVKLNIVGHTDNTGDADKNLNLSKQRAMAVKSWLSQHGIASNRITAEGKGQTQPTASNNTKEGQAKNRRIEAYITAR